MLLKDQRVKEEIKKEIKKYLETNDNEGTTTQKSMGCHKSRAQREIHSNIGLPQKKKKKKKKKKNTKRKKEKKKNIKKKT